MSTLSEEDFLKPLPRRIERVELPVKGGVVFVRKLNVDEQIQREAEYSALDESDTKGYTAISLAFYLCTEDGRPFTTVARMREHLGSLDPQDVAAIMKKGNEINRGLAPAAVENAAGN
jgi:hypothetical protein